MGLMGLMGEEVVSLVVLSVSDWVRWWVWSEVRSREIIFSRSRVVVRRIKLNNLCYNGTKLNNQNVRKIHKGR